MATKSISQLTEVTSDLGTDKLEIAKVDALSASGYISGSTTVDKLGAYINGTETFSTLPTTDKTIVGSISECFQSVSDGKTLIATAITDKGVQTAATDSFSTMATNISNISGGGITPTGTIQISTNGTVDVTNYAYADVSVSGGGGYPSRTVTFNSTVAGNIPTIISAMYFKNGGRTITITVNGTATTHTSVVPSGSSEQEVYNTTIPVVVGSNTVVLSCQTNDIYFLGLQIGESDLPALTDSNTVQDTSQTNTWVSTIGMDQYIVSASSVYTDHYPYRPFNRTDDTGNEAGWHPQSGAPQWVQLELPRAMAISEFTMKNRSQYVESPKDIIFQGSNDGTNWTDITSFEFSPSGQPGVVKTVQITNPSSYVYYRWYYETVNASYGVTCVIDVTLGGLYADETW